MQSQTREIDGRQVHFLHQGAWTKRPIILLHGWGMEASVYEQIGDLLSRGKSSNEELLVIIPDLAGFGGSDPVERADYANFVGHLHGIMINLGIERASFIGHSLGGALAIWFTIWFPEMVEELVLFAPALIPPRRAKLTWVIAALRKHRYNLKVAERAPKSAAKIVSALLGNCKRPLWLVRTFKMTVNCEVVALAEQINTKTHIIWPANDLLFPSQLEICQQLFVKPTDFPQGGHDGLILLPKTAAQLFRELIT